MLRRSPAEYYVKYLLLHPDTYGDDDIVLALSERQLDFPGSHYLVSLRKKLHPPTPFYPYNEQHLSSTEYLLSQGVLTLFQLNASTQRALELLESPRAKQAIEAMVLVDDPDELICRRLASMGYGCAARDLKAYKHYFWNMKMVDSTDLKTILVNRAESVLQGNDAGNQARYKAMRSAIYQDPRYMVATSPIPQLAAIKNKMLLGYMPDEGTMSKLKKALHLGIAVSLADAVMGNDKDKSMKVRDLASALKTLEESIAESGDEDGKLVEQVVGVSIQTDGEEVPHINEVSGGDHTTSYLPAKEEGHE